MSLIARRTPPTPTTRSVDSWVVSELAGVRTLLVVPMLKEDELVGGFTIYRQEVRPFTEKQIALVQELRRPSRHRHRERAVAQRAARENRQGAIAEVETQQ